MTVCVTFFNYLSPASWFLMSVVYVISLSLDLHVLALVPFPHTRWREPQRTCLTVLLHPSICCSTKQFISTSSSSSTSSSFFIVSIFLMLRKGFKTSPAPFLCSTSYLLLASYLLLTNCCCCCFVTVIICFVCLCVWERGRERGPAMVATTE